MNIPAHPTLLVITDSEPARQVAAQSLNDWSGAAGVAVEMVDLATALAGDQADFEQAAAVWLVLDNAAPAQVYELMGRAQEQPVAAMLTRPGESRLAGTMHEDGVVVCPPTAEPVVVRAVIGALLSQAGLMQEAARELRVLHAQRSGLCGQIDRMDEELRLASQLQREFLPARMPSVADVAFHALWRPAGYVSGDIYDVQRLDESHVGFFVADAVGHGVPAALMTMYIKRSMRTKEMDPFDESGYRLIEPAEALGRLNKDMVERQSGKVRFATACYGLINCRTRELRFARAGHPYPMLLRADGDTQSLEPEGGLLGVFPDEIFEQVSITLDPGDRLLLYSDGFEVAFPTGSGEETGQRQKLMTMRYAEEFLDLRHGPVDEALARLDEKLNVQAGSLSQRDDLTVVCLAVDREAEVPETAGCSVAVA